MRTIDVSEEEYEVILAIRRTKAVQPANTDARESKPRSFLDADAMLEEIRTMGAQLEELAAMNLETPASQEVIDAILEHKMDIVDAFGGLDRHLMAGGALPEAWRRP